MIESLTTLGFVFSYHNSFVLLIKPGVNFLNILDLKFLTNLHEYVSPMLNLYLAFILPCDLSATSTPGFPFSISTVFHPSHSFFFLHSHLHLLAPIYSPSFVCFLSLSSLSNFLHLPGRSPPSLQKSITVMDQKGGGKQAKKRRV